MGGRGQGEGVEGRGTFCYICRLCVLRLRSKKIKFIQGAAADKVQGNNYLVNFTSFMLRRNKNMRQKEARV